MPPPSIRLQHPGSFDPCRWRISQSAHPSKTVVEWLMRPSWTGDSRLHGAGGSLRLSGRGDNTGGACGANGGALWLRRRDRDRAGGGEPPGRSERAPGQAAGGNGGAPRSRSRRGAAISGAAGEVAPERRKAAQRGRERRAQAIPTGGGVSASGPRRPGTATRLHHCCLPSAKPPSSLPSLPGARAIHGQ